MDKAASVKVSDKAVSVKVSDKAVSVKVSDKAASVKDSDKAASVKDSDKEVSDKEVSDKEVSDKEASDKEVSDKAALDKDREDSAAWAIGLKQTFTSWATTTLSRSIFPATPEIISRPSFSVTSCSSYRSPLSDPTTSTSMSDHLANRKSPESFTFLKMPTLRRSTLL